MDEQKSLLSWTFPEFIQHQRGRAWYIAFFAMIIGLVVLGFFTANYTFIAVIIMAAFVLILRFRRIPHQVEISITEKGVVVGGRI